MNEDLSSLPDEVRALIEAPEVLSQEIRDKLSQTIAELRDDAVSARKESGIEETWQRYEDAYIGIDDTNRAEFAGAKWAKGMTMDAPLVRATQGADETKATAFVKLTARYVDAGAAKVCEIALPADGKAFTLKATPVPEMAGAEENDTPAEQVTGQPMPGPDGQPVTVATLAKHALAEAEAAAEKAATRIHDWMVEYKHNAEMRKVIFDMARIGTGVLCGPIPDSKRVVVVNKDKQTGQVSIKIVEKVKPIARWVDPWNFFPAPGCGENIHKGPFAFELDSMLETELAGLAKATGLYYLPEAIAKVIEEGPGKKYVNSQDQRRPNKLAYQVWHFRGSIPRKDFEAANPKQASEQDSAAYKAANRVDVVITLVNDTVVRAVLSPKPTSRSSWLALLSCSCWPPKVSGVVLPLWPWLMRGMLLCSSASLKPSSTIFISCSVTLGHSKAANTLRTSSTVCPFLMNHSLSGVIRLFPFAGSTTLGSITTWEPADLAPLLSMARTPPLTMRWGVSICSPTPTPVQCPARRRHLPTW